MLIYVFTHLTFVLISTPAINIYFCLQNFQIFFFLLKYNNLSWFSLLYVIIEIVNNLSCKILQISVAVLVFYLFRILWSICCKSRIIVYNDLLCANHIQNARLWFIYVEVFFFWEKDPYLNFFCRLELDIYSVMERPRAGTHTSSSLRGNSQIF